MNDTFYRFFLNDDKNNKSVLFSPNVNGKGTRKFAKIKSYLL